MNLGTVIIPVSLFDRKENNQKIKKKVPLVSGAHVPYSCTMVSHGRERPQSLLKPVPVVTKLREKTMTSVQQRSFLTLD